MGPAEPLQEPRTHALRADAHTGDPGRFHGHGLVPIEGIGVCFDRPFDQPVRLAPPSNRLEEAAEAVRVEDGRRSSADVDRPERERAFRSKPVDLPGQNERNRSSPGPSNRDVTLNEQ